MNEITNNNTSAIVNLESPLIDFEGFCTYMNLGTTKARAMLKNPKCPYVVRLGRRVLVHKGLLDKELERAAKYHITL